MRARPLLVLAACPVASAASHAVVPPAPGDGDGDAEAGADEASEEHLLETGDQDAVARHRETFRRGRKGTC